MSAGIAETRDVYKSTAESVAHLDADVEGMWATEIASIEAAIAEHYGDGLTETLTPARDHAELRGLLRAAAQRLTALTDHICGLFDDGVSGVIVPKLGLEGFELAQQRTGVFALAQLLGDVTPTHPVDNRVIWDVQNHEAGTGHSNFSENDREAEYHTDSALLPIPERFFLLYAVKQATCGGGESYLRDCRVLIQELEATLEGKIAVEVLRTTELPTRVPKAFRKNAQVVGAYSYRTIIGDTPLWRWRKDKIEAGLVAHPEYATDEVRKALDTVDARLADTTDELREPIPTDGLLIVNNHVALHGRSAFKDPTRHLLRIRFHEPA